MSNIRVALRVRPLNEKEKDEGSKEIVKVNKNSVRIENAKVLGIPELGDSRSRIREFMFDHIYDCMYGENALSSQLKVFEDLGTDVLKAAFDGFNACVFAYGQTGTGKTHTMMGYPGDVGLIPRICEGLFTHMSQSTDENLTCRIDVSYFEIYNERVRDLLQPEMLKLNENYSLKVREHPKDGPYVKDLSWHRVKTNEDIQTILDNGNKYRVTAETYMHGHSSRSHAIVTVCYTQARLEENRPSEIVSKINLVDLAGSERADPSSKPDFRKRLTEGANINKSLVTLGYVIKALAEKSLLSWSIGDMGSTQSFHSSGGGETGASMNPAGPNKQRVPYIPYRDSVLTWLLRDSLGGNSKTIMIATITPASQYYSESISTLRYAQRAKNIINKPRINEDTNVALIRELRQEIERLHRMLATAQMPASQLGPSYLPGDIVYFVPDLHRGQDDSNDESGSMVTLQESEDAIIAEKLHENEEMAKRLTQSWMGKWSSTHDIMKESDLSIRGLHNQSSSMGVMIDSQLPYLIGMDDDVLSTGIVIFHLKEGDTLIGREDADSAQDIVLHGPTIQKDHCVIKHVNGEVYLHPCPGSMCAVQDIECTEPIKLTQGDYVILGGNQHFRFNNPSEAAKLRENRRSQGSLNTLNTSHLSFGGLSRASSYSSIGGDDSNYLSPPQLGRSYPNGRRRYSDAVIYAAPDLCRDLERRYQTEQERIAEASKELERLKAEHERAEELRQLKEEEMYNTHEQHRADIEEQKRHLLRLKEENEIERTQAEEEIQLARESLAKEKDAFQKKLEEERKALKALKKVEEQQESMAIQTDPLTYSSTSVGLDPHSTHTMSIGSDPLPTQSMSVGSDPLTTQSVSVGSENAATTATSTGEDDADVLTDLPVKYKGGRRVSANDQLDDLAQTEFTRRMSYRETEESLAIQQEDIEDAYLQTQAQLEDKLRKIQKMEEEYKEVDKVHLQEMEEQTEKLREIHKQEVQLEVYIQESQELSNVSREKPQPLRTACSEMFLLDPSIQDQQFSQKTTSLLDIQGADSEEQLSPRSRRLRRSSSADSLESGISDVSKDLSMDAERLKAQKDKKITSVAKQVTSRLYQAPEPKFKYVPKTKEKEIKTIPRTKVVRDRTTELKPRTGFDRTARMTKSESPQRVTGKRTSPAQSRNTDIKKRPVSATQRDLKSKQAPATQKDQKSKPGPKPKNAKDDKSKDENQDKPDRNPLRVKTDKNKDQGPNRSNSPSSHLSGALSPPTRQSGVTSPPTRASGAGSPTSRLGAVVSPERLGIAGSNVVRTSPLRQMASATSLASVPESLAEHEDSDVSENQTEQNKVTSYRVKKRQKKGRANFIDDDFRCHSAPDSQRMSQALDDYTEVMNPELQSGVSCSSRLAPYLATSVSVDDSMVIISEDVKTNNIVAEVENEPNEMENETIIDECNVDHAYNHFDCDVEMQETGNMNGKSVNMNISSEEESRCLDDMEMSQESNIDNGIAHQEVNKSLASNTTMDSSDGSILQHNAMETNELTVSENSDNIVLGKRERVDNEMSKETEIPTKKSKSVPDISDNLSYTEQNERIVKVSAGTDTENFSEDSLDLNISMDSLEGEKHSARLTQSLPAYIIRSEKPMSEDSLIGSCDEHDDMESDLKEISKEGYSSDVTPTNNENIVLSGNLHSSISPDVKSDINNDNTAYPTSMEIENIDDQVVIEDNVNTESVNINDGNNNDKDDISQENASDQNTLNLAANVGKNKNDSKEEFDQLPCEEFKVENYISNILKHAQEITCESATNESCLNLDEEPKVHKVSIEDVTNRGDTYLVCNEDRTNETIVLKNNSEDSPAFNDTSATAVNSDDLQTNIEVDQEKGQNLECNPIEDNVDHVNDHDVVSDKPELESKNIAMVKNDVSVVSMEGEDDSSNTEEDPVYTEGTNFSVDETIDKIDIENGYMAQELDNECKESDNTSESENENNDSSRNVCDNLNGATGATCRYDRDETSSDNEDSGKKKGACIDENQNVVSMADGMVEYNRNLVDSDQVINPQIEEDDVNLNLRKNSSGQENMEVEDDNGTLTLEKDNSTQSEPVGSNLLPYTTGDEGEISALSDGEENEGQDIDEISGKDKEESEGCAQLLDTVNASNNVSKDTNQQSESFNKSEGGQISDLELTRCTEESKNDKPDIENQSSPLVKTKSIGVGTSRDLTDGLDITTKGEDNLNLGSEDSFDVDPREKLQELQEALERLPARSGPQLSTARRATRQRAMIRQQHRGGDSDGVAQLSDETPISGTQTKNSTRPSSGSRRRKRPSSKTLDKTNKLFKDQSSDDYDSSENDSVYSDESVDAFKPLKHQNGDAHSASDVRYDSTDGLEFAGRSDTADMPSGSRRKRKRHLSPSLLNEQPDVTEIIDGPDGRRTIGIQTYDHSQRNRSTSSTKTDYSDYDGSFTSEGRGMVMSPLSLWNSNERSDRDSHSDSYSTSSAGCVKNLNDLERDMTQTSRLSTRSNASVFSERIKLQQGQTEVWSTSSSELRPLADVRDDLSYSFETEAMHPATSSIDYTDDAISHHSSVYIRTPREGEQLFTRPDCSTPTNSGRVVNISFPESQLHQASNLDSETPVKFEVTVNENNTNIEYNVEKTEYKTYVLRNQNEPNIIPDRILVSMTENLNSQTEENYATQHREEITMHQPDGIKHEEDSLVLGKSYRTSTSSEKETEFADDKVKREESKELKSETKEDSYHHLPSNKEANKKKMNLQTSDIENTYFPSSSQKEDGVCAPEYKESVGASLNESDYTSDYGTFISVDERYLTVSSDSEECESDPTSKHQSKAQEMSVQNEIKESGASVMVIPEVSLKLCTSSEQNLGKNIAGTQDNSGPVANHSEESQPKEANSAENKLDDSDILHDDGPTTDLGYESMRPESSDEHKDDQNGGNVETDSSSVETVRTAEVSVNETFTSHETQANLRDSTENLENTTESSEHLNAKVPKLDLSQSPMTTKQRQHNLSISSVDEPYLSLDQSESNTSSCSSDYKTPMQSPRENVELEPNSEIVPTEVEDVTIPDYYDDKQSTPRQGSQDFSLDQAPILTSSPKQSNDVRTASVNTESVPTVLQSVSPAISTVKLFGSSKDPVHTEALRKNLEQKIARLTRHVRSLSDSAISSDFTDGDSSSVSPRGSRVYDDKSFLGEKKLLQALRPTQSPTRVRATLNFEGPHPTKVPFKDSGNVYDDDSSSKVLGHKRARQFETSHSQEHYMPLATPVGTFPERLIDSLLAIKPQQLQRSHSLDSLSTIINLKSHLARAVRQVQSIENIPGTISPSDNTVSNSQWKGNYDSMSSDGARSLSPGEIVMDKDMDDIYDMDDIMQVDASQNRKISEKSTSMSVLDGNTREREYHRSLSEGNIDDFEGEADNSNTSNDSITFVFIKDDRTKPNDSEQGNSEHIEGISLSDHSEGQEVFDSENELNDSSQFSIPSEYSDEIVANISGRGPLASKSQDRVSDVLSIGEPEDSVIENNHEEDMISTHSASEEIEEIIDNVQNQELIHGVREMDIINQTDSPPTYTDTSESFVQGRGKYYEEDSEPLRHKYGIDESVLPIPERSVSADNIPKHLKPQNDLMRSRSTGMLDVGVIDEPESESGIFPPARVDTDLTEPSISLHTMSEGEFDQISQRTASDIDASLSNRTSGDIDSENCNSGENSSAVVRSIGSRSSSVLSLVEEFTIDYSTNFGKGRHQSERNQSGDFEDENDDMDENKELRRVLETVQRLICPKPRLVERGMTTENESDPAYISVGIQASPSETSPETSSNLQTFINADQIILPALAAPFRAQSMDSFGLGATGQGLELSEGSRNWCTLGELMVETTHLLRRINDRLPEQARKGSVSSSEDSQVSQVILKKWQEISIQTGLSLEDLTTVGTQTDEECILNGTESMNEGRKSASSKQSMKNLDMANMITHDIVIEKVDLNLSEMSVQTDESFEEFSVIEVREHSECKYLFQNGNSVGETRNNNNNHQADMQTQRSMVTSLDENSTKMLDDNTDQILAQSVSPISFSPKENQQSIDEKVEKKEQKHLHTAKYIPQIKAELGLENVQSNEIAPSRTKTSSPENKEIVNSQNLPGFTLPDMPEITELRKEHAKLMENLRKASDERKDRKEKLKARKVHLSPDESSKLNVSSDTNDKQESLDKSENKKLFKSNKNDPETESSSANSSMVENNVRPAHKDNENIPMKTDFIRSDGDERAMYFEEWVEDVVRSDGDDQESLDNVRSDTDDKESCENVRSDDEDKLVNENDESLNSVTSPLSTQEFVQINIQMDPSSGVTVKNKTIREPSPKRKHESNEKAEKGNINEEHKWEITGDEFKTVWERKTTESRARSESSASEETVFTTVTIEEFPADPAYIEAMKLEGRWGMNKSDENLNHEIIDDVLEVSPTFNTNESRNNKIPDKKESNEQSFESNGRDTPASVIEDIVQPETCLKDQQVPSIIEKMTQQNVQRDTTDNSPSFDKQQTEEFTEEHLESDGRDSPASVIEDIVQPETFIRNQHAPSFTEKMTVQNGHSGKTDNSPSDAKQKRPPQDLRLLEETIIAKVYKREHSLPPSLISKFGEPSPDMVYETEDDSRERKKPQRIFKSETSPKYKEKLTRDQQIDCASPDIMESVEMLPKNMLPHQHYTNSLPDEIAGSNNNFLSSLNNVCKPVTKPPRFSDDSTQMSLAFSDDYTQTDSNLLDDNTPSLDDVDQVSPKYERQNYSEPTVQSHEPGNVQTKPKETRTSEEFREELNSLQQERQHIMDLLGLSYLPNSLTVELLEAKLNYCIGQTDLLLDSLEDTTEAEHVKKKVIQDQRHTKDFISKYRADLKKSKNDIKECREQLNKGRGRGRPATRGRQRTRRGDLLNLQRQAEIDAFKLERLREQQDYARASKHGTPLRGNTPLKGNTPLYGNSPVVTPRSEQSRSTSPNCSPGYMNPREHKAHLVDLRRQLIKDVVEEEMQHSRSCSPSFHTSPPHVHYPTSPPLQHKHRNMSEQSLGFSPKVSPSLSDVPVSPVSSPLSSGGSKTYIVAPGSSSLSPVGRTSSYEPVNPYGSYPSSPDRAYRRRRTSPSSLDREMMAENIFSPQESEQILKEIEELKKRTQISPPIEELLRRSSYSSLSSQRTMLRYMTLFSSTFRKRSSLSRPDVPLMSPRSHSDPRLPRRTSTSPVARQLDNPLSLNLDCLRDEETGPYSPYSAYAREHIIPNERSTPGGVLRGTYELYHDRSDTSSVMSYDSDTFVDEGHRSRHNTLDEETIKRLRPIRAEDIKARINRHKR